jgi:hypothetical protein
MEEQPKIIYSSYTEAQKRATAKYREANKEKVNAQRKKYYESRKEKDPEFLQYKRDKAKEYYLKKKASKSEDLSHLIPQLNEAINILQTEGNDDGHYPLPVTRDNIELVKIDEPEEPIEHEETIEEHWLKKAQARDFVPDVPSVPEPDEEKPPLAWSNVEVVEDVKPEKKERKPRTPRVKPNLKLEDLQELITPSEPKTPKRPRSKKILGPNDILHSA